MRLPSVASACTKLSSTAFPPEKVATFSDLSKKYHESQAKRADGNINAEQVQTGSAMSAEIAKLQNDWQSYKKGGAQSVAKADRRLGVMLLADGVAATQLPPLTKSLQSTIESVSHDPTQASKLGQLKAYAQLFTVVGQEMPKQANSFKTVRSITRQVATAQKMTLPPDPLKLENSFRASAKHLNEDFDDWGRLIQRLGTTDQNGFNNQGLPTWGRPFLSPITEFARNGETQVWNIFNLTGDTHPIHFHLVNVQVISRVPFDADTPEFSAIGRSRKPDPNELGWKETVRMNPNEVTTVAMRFSAPNPATLQPWLSFFKSPRTDGYEYVWHCHILEHEEHDMMRSLVVNP